MFISIDTIKINRRKTSKSQRNFASNIVNIDKEQKNNTESTSPSKRKKVALITTALIAISGLVLIIFKNRKINSKIIDTSDKKYKDLLIKGLKDNFNLETNHSNLKSIMGADEFKETIKKYSPEDFCLGDPKSEDPKEFFKNVIDGKFRITLHNHSDFSDGLLSAQSFIDMAAQYADKIATKLPKSDSRPPFMIALTDHDNFEGCQEIIKIISQNPEKYKNLKFISGAELSVQKDGKHFDLTALGVNPFDKNLTKYVDEIKENRANSARNFISKVNELTGKNITLEELEQQGFKGKNTLKNRSGIVYVVDTMRAIKKMLDKDTATQIENLFENNRTSYKNTPDIDTTIDIVKKAEGTMALTHPGRSFRRFNQNWYESLLKDLKNKGVSGIEANQQYTFKHYKEIADLDQTNSFSRKFAKDNDMFLSGGTDSHSTNIFGHHHKINDELLKKFLT